MSSLVFVQMYRNMKLEPHDDGYETSADLLLNTANHNHDVKCDKLEDPYSFIDDDPIPMLPAAAQGPPHLMHPAMPTLNNQLMPGPKKRGRKKKIKPEQ